MAGAIGGLTRAQAVIMEAQGYHTFARAARLLGISRQTLYTWIEAGKLKPTQVGDRRYIARAEMERHLGPEGAKALGLDGGAA
jgi:excisionase family DNA binding protein